MRRRALLKLLLAAGGLTGSAALGQAQQRVAPRGEGSPPGRGGPDINGLLIRLMQMTPEERDKHLNDSPRFQRLPAARRRMIEQRLAELDKLTPEQKETLVQRFELFSRLPRERQAQARRLYQRWSGLPREERTRVAAAVRRLRRLHPERRRAVMASERFGRELSDPEQELVGEILALMPALPPRPPR